MNIAKTVNKHLLISSLIMIFSAPVSGQSWEEVEQAWDDKNLVEAFEILTALGESGDPEAQLEVGLMYLNGEGITQNDDKSLHWIRKSAENGFAHAQYVMAIAYKRGISVEKDVRNQVWWTRLSAINGFPEAEYMMGLAYSNPFISDDFDIPYSAREGMRWLTRAADQGHDEAMFKLGKLYEDGGLEGIFKNPKKAKHWISLAAEHGNEDANKSLEEIEAQ